MRQICVYVPHKPVRLLSSPQQPRPSLMLGKRPSSFILCCTVCPSLRAQALPGLPCHRTNAACSQPATLSREVPKETTALYCLPQFQTPERKQQPGVERMPRTSPGYFQDFEVCPSGLLPPVTAHVAIQELPNRQTHRSTWPRMGPAASRMLFFGDGTITKVLTARDYNPPAETRHSSKGPIPATTTHARTGLCLDIGMFAISIVPR